MNKFNDQVNFWAHMLDESMNEDVEKTEDGYFTQVTDNSRWLKVKHVLEILDNLPEGAYPNPYIASSLPALIFGYVNGISEQTSKFGKKYVQFTIAPYVNGSRKKDFSAGAEGEPLKAMEIKLQLTKFSLDELVLVKLLDWKNGSDVVLIPFTTILASKSDGIFLRLDAPCEKLEDNASKKTDFGMSIALMMKHHNETEVDEADDIGNEITAETIYDLVDNNLQKLLTFGDEFYDVEVLDDLTLKLVVAGDANVEVHSVAKDNFDDYGCLRIDSDYNYELLQKLCENVNELLASNGIEVNYQVDRESAKAAEQSVNNSALQEYASFGRLHVRYACNVEFKAQK